MNPEAKHQNAGVVSVGRHELNKTCHQLYIPLNGLVDRKDAII